MSAEETAAIDPAAPSLKVDPETLVLRARPQPAIRFRRGVIVSGVAIAAMLVAGTTWYALAPRFPVVSSSKEASDPLPQPPADTLSALPATYANVPKLGPPLPGDLGRPIFERQHQLQTQLGQAGSRPADPAAAEKHERRRNELRAARASGVLVQASHAASVGGEEAPAAATLPAEQGNRLALDPERDPNAQQRKADFMRADDKLADVNPYRIVPPASPFLVSAGSVVSASLITGLRSDLPGLVTAQVTQGVYDSATGRYLLVPQGSRLLGAYDSVVAFGQRRALVVWQRIVFPDGSSLKLDNDPATDPSGYSGLADQVDFHTWQLLKGVVLSTMLGVGAELQFSGGSDLVAALRQSTQQSLSQAGSQITSRNLQVQPTITIRPGAPVRLMVHHDLVLRPWKELE